MIHWWAYPFIDQGQWVMLISWAFWVIFAITLHELGHALVATWQGDPTPRAYGRLSLNPMIHMGTYSIIAFILIGLAWGLTPVNPSRFKWGRMGRVLVAVAGPATNLLLAVICALIWAGLRRATGPDPNSLLSNNLIELVSVGIWINLLLLCFNLLPFPPLDGGAILAAIFRPIDRLYQRPGAVLWGLAVVLMIFLSGLDGPFFSSLAYLSANFESAAQWVIPPR